MTQEKPNMSVARIVRYGSSKIGACERHDERKNSDYGNVNVNPERIPLNVHFKDPGEESYMDILNRLKKEGVVSTKGLRLDAQLFDELILDVNTHYFEEHGGYEFAKKFYEEAYRFAEKVYGEQNIISAVMHADEINKAATDEYGHPVYHYHLHVVALPVVDKEVRWTKRCKNKELVGTVKEVIHQISHSKKWKFTEPMLDETGKQILRKNGKPRFIPSYSILQDDFFNHMKEHGFDDFQRGERGSTAVHLDSVQYQIERDKSRLEEIESKVQAEEIHYKDIREVNETCMSISQMGRDTITGKVVVTRDEFENLTTLAKKAIVSEGEINDLNERLGDLSRKYAGALETIDRLKVEYIRLKSKCHEFLQALDYFPNLVRVFKERVTIRIAQKKAAEREALEKQERKYLAQQRARNQRKKKKYRDRGEAR